MKLTEEMAKEFYIQFAKMCSKQASCNDCISANSKGECQINSTQLRDTLEYLVANKPKTNSDKFQEVFGFPVYELHQLSMQEEGDWLDKEYKEVLSKVD